MSNIDYAARAPSLDTLNPVSDVLPHTRRHSLPSGKSLTFRRFFKTPAKQHQRTHSKPAPVVFAEKSVSPPSIPYPSSPSPPSSPSFSPLSSTPVNLHNNIEEPSRTSEESTSSDREYPSSETSSNGSLDRLKRSFTWKAKHRRVGADSPTPVVPHTSAHETKLKSPEKVVPSSDSRVKNTQAPSNELPHKKSTKLQRWQSKSATKVKSWFLSHSNHSHPLHRSPTTPPTTPTASTVNIPAIINVPATVAILTTVTTTTTTTQPAVHHDHKTSEIQEPKHIEVQTLSTPSEEAPKELTEQNTSIECIPTSNQLHLVNLARFRPIQKHRLHHYRRRSERYANKDGLPLRIPKRSSSLPKSFSPRNAAPFDRRSASIMAPETFSQDDTSSVSSEPEQQPYTEILEDVEEGMDDSSEDEAMGSLVIPTKSLKLDTLSFAASFPLPCSNPASPTSGKPETLFSVTHSDVDQFNQPVPFGYQSEYSNVVEQTLEEQSMVCLEPTINNDRDQTTLGEESLASTLASCTEGTLNPAEQTEYYIEDVVQPEHSEELMQQIEQKISQMEWEIQAHNQALVVEEIDQQKMSEMPEEMLSQSCQHALGFQLYQAHPSNDTNMDLVDDIRCDGMSTAYSDTSSESDTFNNSAFLCEPVEVIEKVAASDSVPTVHREPPVIPKSNRGLVIETLMEMYPSAIMRWRHQSRLCILPAIAFWSSQKAATIELDIEDID
ncbi:hypothetical protein BGX21_009763 [Mortierella sp. AD011]|nr:hypothetical protein BGX20_000995 [Mortierella sp. AD010]KAF9402529.1 hypothetical protein BGX21_009763 [Mortierella sp. AD011]